MGIQEALMHIRFFKLTNNLAAVFTVREDGCGWRDTETACSH